MQFPNQKPVSDITKENIPNIKQQISKFVDVNFIVVPAISASILVARLKVIKHFKPIQVIFGFPSFAKASSMKCVPKIKKIAKTICFEYGKRSLYILFVAVYPIIGIKP